MFDKENFKLSILIPCYNEVSSIDLIINKVLKKHLFREGEYVDLVLFSILEEDFRKVK